MFAVGVEAHNHHNHCFFFFIAGVREGAPGSAWRKARPAVRFPLHSLIARRSPLVAGRWPLAAGRGWLVAGGGSHVVVAIAVANSAQTTNTPLTTRGSGWQSKVAVVNGFGPPQTRLSRLSQKIWSRQRLVFSFFEFTMLCLS